jgi:hypothetical protein
MDNIEHLTKRNYFLTACRSSPGIIGMEEEKLRTEDNILKVIFFKKPLSVALLPKYIRGHTAHLLYFTQWEGNIFDKSMF